MGFITSHTLAQMKYPAFLVEASRVPLRVEPEEGADRVGILKLGDIAVVEEDVLETWPWVLIPAGSRVRDATDPDAIVDLEQDGWMRVAKKAEEEKDIATRCPEGSAAVHLCICRCQHYRVVYDQVLVREEPHETARPTCKLVKGDLLCTGTSSSSSSGASSRDKRWAHFGPDSAVWSSAGGLNNPPKALLTKGNMEGAIMKEHQDYGKLLQLVKQRQTDVRGEKSRIVCDNGHCLQRFNVEAGYPCDQCGAEAGKGDVMWGCHKMSSDSRRPCNIDICSLCRNDKFRGKAASADARQERGDEASATGDPAVDTGALAPAQGAVNGARKQEEEESFWWSRWLKMHKVDDKAVCYSPDLSLEDVNEAAVRKILSGTVHGEEKSDRDHESSKVWLILAKHNAGARANDDPSSDLLLELEALDAIVCAHSHITPMLTSIANQASTWLCLRSGDMILRSGQVIATVTEKPVFVQACLADGTEHARPWDVDSKVTIQALHGFGSPWVVRHKTVPIRNEPSTNALPLGLACRNDIVGVHSEREEWVQLSSSTDSRAKEGGHARPTHDFRTQLNNDIKASLWMLTEHKTIGTLLERFPEDQPCSLSNEGLLLSCTRRGIYRRVTEICHRRIWKDNLDDLWEGEVEKLPPVETIEAKLFRPNVEVLHARRGGEFKGGAIVEEIQIEVRQEKERPAWVGASNFTEQPVRKKAVVRSKANGKTLSSDDAFEPKGKDGDWEIRRAHIRIGYVHCCATEPGSRVGKALWDELCRQAAAKHFLIVACHSILRQGTVDFWRSVGMKRVDPQDAQDRALFKSQVNVRSQGSLHLEVEDVVKALPKSALPLFIWENAPALEAWSQEADRWEVESEEEDEAKAAIDKKLKREILKMRHHQKSR